MTLSDPAAGPLGSRTRALDGAGVLAAARGDYRGAPRLPRARLRLWGRRRASGAAAGEEAVRALTSLGYSPAAAEEAIRQVLAAGGEEETGQVVRRALQWRAKPRGGK